MKLLKLLEVQKQLEKEQMNWARDVKMIKDKNRLDAYQAGLQQGMNLILAYLKLHGHLETEDS